MLAIDIWQISLWIYKGEPKKKPNYVYVSFIYLFFLNVNLL